MPTLPQFRKQIDRLDDCIVKLLNQRMRLAHKIGRIKARNGNHVYDRKRETEVLTRICKRQKGPLEKDELRSIYAKVLKISREHQKRVCKNGC